MSRGSMGAVRGERMFAHLGRTSLLGSFALILAGPLEQRLMEWRPAWGWAWEQRLLGASTWGGLSDPPPAGSSRAWPQAVFFVDDAHRTPGRADRRRAVRGHPRTTQRWRVHRAVKVSHEAASSRSGSTGWAGASRCTRSPARLFWGAGGRRHNESKRRPVPVGGGSVHGPLRGLSRHVSWPCCGQACRRAFLCGALLTRIRCI